MTAGHALFDPSGSYLIGELSINHSSMFGLENTNKNKTYIVPF